MIYVFYSLATLLVWFSYKSFRGGIDYLKFFKREIAKPLSTYTPFATIIAPCKGLDEGLEKNLRALLEQDYPAYEVIFVVDDQNDPSVSTFEKLVNRQEAETQRIFNQDRQDGQDFLEMVNVANHPEHPVHPVNFSSASPGLGGEKIVVAPKAVESSQKVVNLREAVLHASDRSEVFVFVDSDARPASEWLRYLVAPLADKSVGAASGYRWYISKNPSFASEMRNMWNASIASALGPNTASNFCWGGSMAIRRDTFETLNIREKWRGTLSDDFTVTRAMNEAGLKIHFVPQALTPSVENCSLREMFEFTNRQMKITRVYAQKLWLMSFFGSGLFNAVMAAAFLIVIFSGRNSFAVWFSIGTLVLVSIFSIAKSTLRLRAVRLVLTDYENETRKQYFYQNVLWLLAPALFFINCIAALFSRRINWRGTVYEMHSATETSIIHSHES